MSLSFRPSPHLARLRALEPFADANRSTLYELRRCLTELPIRAGTTLIREGSVGQEFFFIESGSVSVEQDGHVVGTLGAGDWFGELSLLHNTPRNARVVALEDSNVFVASRSEFSSLLFHHPALARRIKELARLRLGAIDHGVVA